MKQIIPMALFALLLHTGIAASQPTKRTLPKKAETTIGTYHFSGKRSAAAVMAHTTGYSKRQKRIATFTAKLLANIQMTLRCKAKGILEITQMMPVLRKISGHGKARTFSGKWEDKGPKTLLFWGKKKLICKRKADELFCELPKPTKVRLFYYFKKEKK